jgi:hypothetical protein
VNLSSTIVRHFLVAGVNIFSSHLVGITRSKQDTDILVWDCTVKASVACLNEQLSERTFSPKPVSCFNEVSLSNYRFL